MLRYSKICSANGVIVGLGAMVLFAAGCGSSDASTAPQPTYEPFDAGATETEPGPDVLKGDQPNKPDAALPKEDAELPKQDSSVPAPCFLGDALCSPSGTLLLCDSAGSWVAAGCPGACDEGSTGAHCRGAVDSLLYEATVQYESRKPNDTLTDWGPIFQRPARGLLAKSFQGNTLVDVQMADSQGRVRILVPKNLAAGDLITLWAIEPGDSATRASVAVVEPDAPDGFANSNQQKASLQGVWHWSFDPSLSTSPASFLITEQGGSGAVQVFDNVRRVRDVAQAIFGTSGPSLLVWLRLNTYWSCGSCFWNEPTASKVVGQQFDTQLFVPASSLDLEYWSDSMILHETGHWLVNGYGKDPGEGGSHYVGCPTFPGQAWGEAWPTWMSATLRNDPVYVVKMNGSMYWTDLDQREFSGGVPWPRPSATATEGLLQRVEENEVAAMLWRISDHSSQNAESNPLLVNRSMVHALASARMTTAPFARGYTRHTWGTGSGCSLVSVQDTHESVPFLADFLDSLLCTEGMDPARVDSATEPTTYYPYSAQAPMCQ